MFTDGLVSLCVVVFVIGVTVIWRSSRRRVQDGSLNCRRCGYRVDRSNSEFCSECGLLITERTVIKGRREPAYVPMAIAGLFAVPAFLLFAMSVTMQIRGTDLMPYLPSWYLLRAEMTSDANFANEEVAVLRRRQLNERMSENQERQLIDFLARRALEMTNDRYQRNPNFTIHTLTLFRRQKPSQPLLDEYLAAVLRNERFQNPSHVQVDDDSVVIIGMPQYYSSSPFYDFKSPPLTLTWRMDIRIARQGEVMLPVRMLGEQTGAVWNLSQYRADGGPITIVARVRWYIEPASSEAARIITTEPWHVMETSFEVTPEG